MKAPFFSFVLVVFGLRPSAHSMVNYSGLQNLPIPTTFTGIYIDIDTATTSTTPGAGWDINAFFGGIGLGGSASFHPARHGPGNTDTIRRLALNDVIDSGLIYATGTSGSSDHLGASGNFQAGTEGHLGFRFVTNGSSGPFYGWMRLTLTSNTAGAVVHDWAWEDNGGAIQAGSLVSIPEPSTALIFVTGIFAAAFVRTRCGISSASSAAAATPGTDGPPGPVARAHA